MNIRDLQYLIALSETRHFGQAAEQSYVSQPTLSAQIKKIEQELGVTLIERSSKGVMMTPVGKRIVAEARVILQHVSKIKHLASTGQDPLSGSFRLGIIPTLGPYLLPYILQAIKKTLPKLELIVQENKTDIVLTELRHGNLDAVILALPVKTEGLVQERLFDEPFYIALPKNHALVKKDAINMKDIERETLLLLEEGHCLREQALEACKFAVERYSNDFRATSLETLRQIVSLGAGITFIPALAVKSARVDKNIVVRPIAGSTPSRQIGMLWRQSAVNEPCCYEIVKIIQKQIQQCEDINRIEKMHLVNKIVG